jgi:hypothetical protein
VEVVGRRLRGSLPQHAGWPFPASEVVAKGG